MTKLRRFFVLSLSLTLIALPVAATAQNLEEMMQRMTGQEQKPSHSAQTPDALMKQLQASPQPAGTSPKTAIKEPATKTSPTAPATTSTLPIPSTTPPATSPAANAQPVISTKTEKLPLTAGSCGVLGKLYGCPQGGVVTPNNLSELNTMYASLIGILQAANSNSGSDAKTLLQLANRLGTIQPGKLESQLTALDQAQPAYQFGMLRRIDPPIFGNGATNPLQLMETLVEGVIAKTGNLENGIQQALSQLKQLQNKNAAPQFQAELQQRITRLEELITTKAASKTAQQALKPFLDAQGRNLSAPATGKPLTVQQIAATLSLLSVEDGFSQSGSPFIPAHTKSQQETSPDGL